MVSILLILMVFPFKSPAGLNQGYGVAWAFGGGLRYIDEVALNAVMGGDVKEIQGGNAVIYLSDYAKSHPFWGKVTSVQKVAVSLLCFVIGGFAAALISGEFGIKFDKSAVLDSIVGGVLMGIGIAYMTQCNVGVFMGAVSQLALGGYLAVIGIIIGTYIGAKYYERKMGL
ncbi:MAG: YeeE/YedE family protein [Euryarchaeota archaeon]|nr:YeeE/YedE family protein [Euryarchaeota archaeon]